MSYEGIKCDLCQKPMAKKGGNYTVELDAVGPREKIGDEYWLPRITCQVTMARFKIIQSDQTIHVPIVSPAESDICVDCRVQFLEEMILAIKFEGKRS